MKCPKCDTQMKVHHVFRINGEAHTARHECPKLKCGHICTTVTLLIHSDPASGKGAYAVAEKMKQKSTALKAVQERIARQF